MVGLTTHANSNVMDELDMDDEDEIYFNDRDEEPCNQLVEVECCLIVHFKNQGAILFQHKMSTMCYATASHLG